ncbi:MAG TPA: hypothetical protein VFE55_10895 [Acidimicrobiia bacterium]|nr:hypothetical protein [Acidimicrobiia bacterium]
MLPARPVAADPEAGLSAADEPPGDGRRPGARCRAARGLRGVPAGGAGPVLAAVLALFLVRGVVGGRPPAGEDVMAHLIRADFALPHLVAHLRPDGWFPRMVVGQDEFLFNGPGLTWLVGLLRTLTLGALSTTGALKVVSVAGVVTLPPAVAFLARSYGLTRPAAGLAAVLSLLVSSPYGPGLQGLFAVGLIPNQIGAVLFCVALGAVVRTLEGTGPGRWPPLAALASAALLVTHLISALILAAFVALTLVARAAAGRLTRRGLGRLAAVAAASGGLAAFWLVPMLAHRDLHGVYTGWNTPPLPTRLADVVTGQVLLPAGFAVLVVAGWVYQLRRGPGRRAALVWVAVGAAYLPVAYAVLRVFGPGDVTLQLPNRGLGYVGLLATFAVAAPLAAAAGRFGRNGYAALLALAAAAVLAFAPGRGAPGQLAEPHPELRAAAGALRVLVPPGARFATQRDWPAEISHTGVVHPETWLARVSGRDTLNGYNLEAVSTPGAALVPESIEADEPAVSADRLARYGVSHVVLTDDRGAGRLVASGRFRLVWRVSPIVILAVEPRHDAPPPASLVESPVPLSAFLVDARAEHLGVDVHTDRRAPVSLAVAWSPKWHGRLDGRRLHLGRTPDGLIEAAVPPGDHELRLHYRRDGWDRLGLGLSVLTAAGWAGAGRGRARQLMSRIFSRTA